MRQSTSRTLVQHTRQDTKLQQVHACNIKYNNCYIKYMCVNMGKHLEQCSNKGAMNYATATKKTGASKQEKQETYFNVQNPG